jgi:competence protein ComEC
MRKRGTFLLFFLSILLVEMSPFWCVVGHGSVVSVTTAEVTVHFIDVGQGDSILIATFGSDVLVDGGTQASGSVVVSYLSKMNITNLSLMVATHMDEDHIGGLITVLSSNIRVGKVLINGMAGNTATYTNFMNLAQSHTVTATHRGENFVLTPTTNLTILNPTQPLQFSDQNDNSIVMRLQAGETSFLLTGDAEADAEQSMINAGLNLKSNVLKVGHHGSRYATTDQFLNSVSPSYAIISAGKDNPYGFPHAETIQRLLSHGVTIYGTFQSGTIVGTTDGTLMTFQDSPQPIPEYATYAIPAMMISVLLAATVYKKRAFKRIGTEGFNQKQLISEVIPKTS